MSERDEFGAFLIGFIVGGLTGAAVSLLLAPQSGEETRGYLRERAIELREKANETASTAAEQVNERTSVVRTRASELADQARTRAEELKSRGQVALEEQKAKLASLRKKEEDEGPMGAI